MKVENRTEIDAVNGGDSPAPRPRNHRILIPTGVEAEATEFDAGRVDADSIASSEEQIARWASVGLGILQTLVLIGVGFGLIQLAARLASEMERLAKSIEKIAEDGCLSPPPLNVSEAARFANVTDKTIYRWVKDGLLKPLSARRPLLFEVSAIKAALNRRNGVL